LSSTTQGLDGLMIELDSSRTAVARATIFEDKCSENPRAVFLAQIMPAFQIHHENQRAADLVATAAVLLANTELNDAEATIAAARVLDRKYRAYRGSLAVTPSDDSLARRKSLFADYQELKDIDANQRIGAVFITSDNLRAWFDDLALQAIAYVDQLDETQNV